MSVLKYRPAAHEPETVWHDLNPRLLTVVAVRPLSPAMVRITFTGDDLDVFCYQAPDDHVKVFLPRPGEDLPVMPTLGEDGLEPPPSGAPQPVFRDYTVRYLRREKRELDIDFALHGHGPGATWAAGARPGMQVGVLGPRGSLVVPGDFDWYLLGADDTALPALGAWLEFLPESTRVHAVAEVQDAAHRVELPERPGLTVVWAYRSADPTALETAVRAFEPPAGDGYVWIGGEAGVLKPIRRHVRGFGLPKNRVEVDGYWRRGTENHDHHDLDED